MRVVTNTISRRNLLMVLKILNYQKFNNPSAKITEVKGKMKGQLIIMIVRSIVIVGVIVTLFCLVIR